MIDPEQDREIKNHFLRKNNFNVDFLHSLKIKKTPWPVTYMIALVVVLISLTWWFSVKPEFSAYNFLPDNTTFYYQWTDRDWQGDQHTIIFDRAVPLAKIADLENILEVMMAQIEEVIWFQTDNINEDHYLLRVVGNLSKEEIEYLTKENSDWFFTRINDQILLITKQEQLSEQLSPALVNKLPMAQRRVGENIYFDPTQAPEFLNSLIQYLKTDFSEQEIFLQLDFDGKTYLVDIYQVKNEEDETEDTSWSQISLPKKFQAVLAINNLSLETQKWLSQFIVAKLFVDLPGFYIFDENILNNLWQTSSLIKIDDQQWLWVGHNDWQEYIFSLLPNFTTKEVARTLVDGTLYTELVKNTELEFQNFSLGEQSYWQMGDLFGVQVNDLYYLSNSEASIKNILLHSKSATDFWRNCSFNSSSLVTDWVHLDDKSIAIIGLGEYLPNKVDQLDIFAYQNHLTHGYRLCFE